jgi:hypothetical protein
MATTSKWITPCIGKPLADPSGIGQWSGLCYNSKRGKCITAFCSPQQHHKGGYGYNDQQYAMLLSKGIANAIVCKQFIIDLALFINKMQHDGCDIVLSLNANETMGQETTMDLAHLLSECTLMLDLHLFGPSDPLATYKYGTEHCIDFMLGTTAVANTVCFARFMR